MEILINNIGWFFCIVIVTVLALIGYKADKKEKKQSNNNEKNSLMDEHIEKPQEEVKTNNIQEINNDIYYTSTNENEEDIFKTDIDNSNMADLFEPLNPVQYNDSVEQKIEEPDKNQDQTINEIQDPSPNNTKQEIKELEQIVPNLDNIENLDLSFQDLENKENNENKNQQEETKEQNTIGNAQIEYEISENKNTSKEEIKNQNSNQNEKLEQETSNEINNQQQNSTEQTKSDETNQIEKNNNQNPQENEKNEFEFNKPEPNYTGEIPEIFIQNQVSDNKEENIEKLEKIENPDDNKGTTNLYIDSLDDDIWKF